MNYWIFDLDDTIYMTRNVMYENIKQDIYLRCLISSLNGKKYVFTNALLIHAEAVLRKLGIIDLFEDVIDRSRLNGIKPHMETFRKFLYLTNINKNDKCVFFEDNINNLVTAKRLGWTTVLISPTDRRFYNHIDYNFRDIQSAVESFTFNSSHCLR